MAGQFPDYIAEMGGMNTHLAGNITQLEHAVCFTADHFVQMLIDQGEIISINGFASFHNIKFVFFWRMEW